MSVVYLSLQDLLMLHSAIIEDFGGSHGIREEGRLISVIEAPKQSIFGQDQYPSIYQKAAVYTRNIIADHPFIDGNKRTAIAAGGVFLLQNKFKLNAAPKELEDFAVKIAVDHLSIPDIAAWLEARSQAA